MPGDDFHIKLIAAVLYKGIDQPGQCAEVNNFSAGLVAAKSATEIPEIHTFRQCTIALALDIFANVVLARLDQAVTVFTVDVEQVGFSHGMVLLGG